MRTCTYPISRFLSMIAHFGFVRIGVSHRCPISVYSKCASLNDLYLYVDFSPNPGNPQLDQDCLNPKKMMEWYQLDQSHFPLLTLACDPWGSP